MKLKISNASMALKGPFVNRNQSHWKFSVLSTAEIDDMMPKMSKVFTGDTLQRVACRPPHGRPEPEVWWERGGQRVPTEGRVYQDGLDLVFSPTQGGDSGTYICVAQNKAGRRTQEVIFTVASESYSDGYNRAFHQFYTLTVQLMGKLYKCQKKITLIIVFRPF